MKKTAKILLGFSIFVLCAVGLYLFQGERKGAVYGVVRKGDLRQVVTLTGRAESKRTTQISPPYNGYVKRLFVKVGEHVSFGAPLVTLAQSLTVAEESFPIRAPFEGTITQINKTQGQYTIANSATDFILRMDDLTERFVSADVPEVDRLQVRVGAKGVVRISAISDQVFDALVEEVAEAPVVKNEWGARSQVEYQAKMKVLNSTDAIKPGMTAIVDLTVNERKGVLLLEHQYFSKEQGHYSVTLKNGEKREVTLGLKGDDAIEILSGLNEGDEVQTVDFEALARGSI